MRIANYLKCAAPNREQFEAERERCLAYAAHVGHEVVAVYEDYNQSGLNANRLGLQALLTDAASGAFDAILVDQVDRLSRDWQHFATILTRLDDYKVAIITPNMDRYAPYKARRA